LYDYEHIHFKTKTTSKHIVSGVHYN